MRGEGLGLGLGLGLRARLPYGSPICARSCLPAALASSSAVRGPASLSSSARGSATWRPKLALCRRRVGRGDALREASFEPFLVPGST